MGGRKTSSIGLDNVARAALNAADLGSMDGSVFKFDRHEDRTIPLPGRLTNAT